MFNISIMEINANDLSKKVAELFNQEKFEEIITLLTDEVLKKKLEKERDKVAELYVWRGNTWYNKKEYDKAITDYDKAIEINPKYALAFYNRGFAWVAKEKYNKAIADYDKIIEINPDSASAYVSRGAVRRALKEYNTAIADYSKAIEIDPNSASAYYNRGVAKKENKVDLEGSKHDFEKYLELTADENDLWAKYANYYIEYINERINDKELSVIIDLIAKIKDLLLINEDCVTHYTSLSVLKTLILDSNKFRISEGNFMNDPSEGKVFFNFLQYKPYTSCEDASLSENFSPKPFIGSFVTKDKYDDLNMWRFYGKEEGVEAKGCAITLRTQEFIEDINNSLPKGEEDYLEYKSDINFYGVVYLGTGTTNFYISSSDKSKGLMKLMTELKKKVKSYKIEDKTSLEKHLNSIAFLFKSDAYKNENEVRLVVNGIEFEKKYDMKMTPPRVYIELETIKKVVKQITLGPKVDKVNEWTSAFHYSYEVNMPEIIISHLPYK
jgi:Tfp pilus assembly protein PilF